MRINRYGNGRKTLTSSHHARWFLPWPRSHCTTFSGRQRRVTFVKTISIDAMGGDFGPSVTVPASLQVLRRQPDLKLLFVGLAESLQPLLSNKAAMYKIVLAS